MQIYPVDFPAVQYMISVVQALQFNCTKSDEGRNIFTCKKADHMYNRNYYSCVQDIEEF